MNVHGCYTKYVLLPLGDPPQFCTVCHSFLGICYGHLGYHFLHTWQQAPNGPWGIPLFQKYPTQKIPICPKKRDFPFFILFWGWD